METDVNRRGINRAGRGARLALAVGLAVSLVVGCSGIKPGRSPEATFEAIRRAMLEKEYEALWGLLSAKARELEVAAVQQQQRTWEQSLDNMTSPEKQKFLSENGVTPEEFVNMSPAEVFAMNVRRTARLVTALAEQLAAARVIGVRTEGEAATLEITVGAGEGEAEGDEEKVSLTLEREHGVYRVKSFQELLTAFRPAERSRRPGRTPKETFEAFRACVRDRAYEDLWDLFTPFMREKLAEAMEGLKRQLEEMLGSARRKRERGLGAAAEEFAAMAPKEAFATSIRFNIEVQRRLPPILLGEFVSAEIEAGGDRAKILLRGRRGEHRITAVFTDGVWLLEGF